MLYRGLKSRCRVLPCVLHAVIVDVIGSNETKSHTQTEKIFKFTNESLRLCYFFCLHLTFTHYSELYRLFQHMANVRLRAVVLLLLLLLLK